MHLEKEFCDVECVGVENIWPTPLAYYKYPEDKQEEFKEAVRRAIKKVEGGKNDWQDNIWHFYQHANEHLLNDNKDEPIFEHFHTWAKVLLQRLCDYIAEVGYGSQCICY